MKEFIMRVQSAGTTQSGAEGVNETLQLVHTHPSGRQIEEGVQSGGLSLMSRASAEPSTDDLRGGQYVRVTIKRVTNPPKDEAPAPAAPAPGAPAAVTATPINPAHA